MAQETKEEMILDLTRGDRAGIQAFENLIKKFSVMFPEETKRDLRTPAAMVNALSGAIVELLTKAVPDLSMDEVAAIFGGILGWKLDPSVQSQPEFKNAHVELAEIFTASLVRAMRSRQAQETKVVI